MQSGRQFSYDPCMTVPRRRLLAVAAAPVLAQTKEGQRAKGGTAKAGFAYPPVIEGARTEVYKTVGDVKLQLWILNPAGHSASDRRAAIVFFFGGGWTGGNPAQFEQQSRRLAKAGMVAIMADYRVASRHGVKAIDCVRDAKSAIRWVRSNAARLGIDPKRIAAGGGSAGGHLAAATGVIAGLDEAGENTRIPSRPDAMVLFNPALVLAPAPGVAAQMPANLAERTGGDPAAVSPYQHVKKGAPPAIIFHGKADTTVPYVTAEAFATKMVKAGNRCELAGYEGQTHGFFNYGRGGNEYYEKTMARTEEFLRSLGYLSR